MKKVLSLTLAAIMIFSCAAISASAKTDYVIENPYQEVIWSGDGAWDAYKGNLHTHSFVSDANTDFKDMVMEYYNQGFDFLAMTEHAVTGKAWNEKPVSLPLYFYQRIIGNKVHYLTDEEYTAVTTGTYPVNGVARGKGMTCVPGGNELNGLTIRKNHVNAIFLPEDVGNNHLGFENDYEGAVKIAHEAGALSFINHPGDWLGSRDNPSESTNPDNVNYFADILLRYDSCLGMEVFNENNGVTPNDRVLWDALLMKCLPYGKTIIGFANGDTHYLSDVDSTFSVFMMESNTVENIKKTMQNGAFFMITRKLAKNDELGPKENMDAKNKGLAYPMFTDIKVDGHKISVKANEYSNIQWVADGKVIATQDISQSSENSEYVLDLDMIAGSDEFSYVRCQLIGEGGITLTQAFVIDDGSAPLTYSEDARFETTKNSVVSKILSARFFVIIQALVKLIQKEFK